ncbi:hypothetical protein GCM10022376_02530 [Yimella lutea]
MQVPAVSIAEGESPEDAVVRGVEEQGAGITARIVRSLGLESYDMWPAKPEVNERHFFQLVNWTCW